LVFAMPYQFLPAVLESIRGTVKPGAVAVSLIKHTLEVKGESPVLTSTTIQDVLGIETAVLSGASFAMEVARGDFTEATLATSASRTGNLLALLFHRPMFQIREVHDVASVDMASGLMGALALAGGICDGIGLGGNTKAAIIRLGVLDAASLIAKFYPASQRDTLFESCGIADLISLSMAPTGRHRKCAENFARFMASAHRLSSLSGGMKVDNWQVFAAQVWDDVLAAESGGGTCITGVTTLKNIWPLVEKADLTESLPLMASLHRVAIRGDPPARLVDF